MGEDLMYKDNIYEVLISLIKLTDKINDEKLDKIKTKLEDFFCYQKYEIFLELLIKKGQDKEYENKVLNIIGETLLKNEEFQKYYAKNLLIQNNEFFTKNFKFFIINCLNKKNLFGEVMGISINFKDTEPKLIRGENLKDGLIFLLKDEKNREIFLQNAGESYRNKILNFFIYHNPKFYESLKNKVAQNEIWKNVFDKKQEENKRKKILDKIELKNINNLRELRTYIFKMQLDNISTDLNVDYGDIYIEKKELILSSLANIDFELYHKFLNSLDNSYKIELIERSLETDFADGSIFGLLSNQFDSENKNIIFGEDIINKFYKKFEDYCLKKEFKEKNPGEGIYNEIDILVEFYFNFNKKLVHINSKREKLKDKYLNYYSYYLGILGKEKDFINLDRIDYINLFRGLVYNKNNLKNKVLNNIKGIESKLLEFVKCSFTDTYRTKYYLNFLLEKEVDVDKMYTKDNINILKEIAIKKRDRELLSKILKSNTGLEYDKELFEFLFRNENDETLKNIITEIYRTSDLKVIIFKDEVEDLVERLTNPELKVLFLLWIILRLDNIILEIKAVNILERGIYKDVEISKEMIDIFSIHDFVDLKGKIEMGILKKKISNPELHFWN